MWVLAFKEIGDRKVEQPRQLVEQPGRHSLAVFLEIPDLLGTYAEHGAELVTAEIAFQTGLADLLSDTKFFQAQAFVPLAQTGIS